MIHAHQAHAVASGGTMGGAFGPKVEAPGASAAAPAASLEAASAEAYLEAHGIHALVQSMATDLVASRPSLEVPWPGCSVYAGERARGGGCTKPARY